MTKFSRRIKAIVRHTTARQYFLELIERDKNAPYLPLLDVACSQGPIGCAVVCGLYRDFSEDLKHESLETQLEISQKWYCHNRPGYACRGNADILGISW